MAAPAAATTREAPGLAVQASPADDPQALYAQREDLSKARRAADLWASALKQDPKSYETAWKLAMARYWLGNHVPEAERRKQYEAGMEAAKTAIALEPNKVEGHFWMSANTGMMAESFGIMAGLKYRIEGSAVLVVPHDAPESAIVVRSYTVLPTFLDRMQTLRESAPGK